MVHPDVKALAKSAGLIDDRDFIKKNYILNNMKKVITLAQDTIVADPLQPAPGKVTTDPETTELTAVLHHVINSRLFLPSFLSFVLGTSLFHIRITKTPTAS